MFFRLVQWRYRYLRLASPDRGNGTGESWRGFITGFYRRSLLLSTFGQRRLSDVQADDECLIMHPDGGLSRKPARACLTWALSLSLHLVSLGARHAFAVPSGRFPVSLGIQLSRCSGADSVSGINPFTVLPKKQGGANPIEEKKLKNLAACQGYDLCVCGQPCQKRLNIWHIRAQVYRP